MVDSLQIFSKYFLDSQCILTQISMKFVPKRPIDNKSVSIDAGNVNK